MTDFSQFQFQDRISSPKSNIYDDREEWEDQIHTAIEDMMPHKKFKRSLIFGIVFGFYFLLTGLIVHLLSLQIVEVVIEYDPSCKFGRNCTVNFTIPQDMIPDIYLQYEIKAAPCMELSNCFFNDTFTLYTDNDTRIAISEESIASSIDEQVFISNELKEYAALNSQKNVSDSELQHRMVWNNPSALAPFRKVWGLIRESLQAGSYYLVIDNAFDTTTYPIDVRLILINPNSIGYPKPGFIISHYILGGINVLIIGYSSIRLSQFWRGKTTISQR